MSFLIRKKSRLFNTLVLVLAFALMGGLAEGARRLGILGATRIADDTTLGFGTGNDVTMEYDENGTDDLRVGGADWVWLDDIKTYWGTDKNASVEYDEDGTDELRWAGATQVYEAGAVYDDDSGDSPSVRWYDAGESFGEILYDDTNDRLKVTASGGTVHFDDENLVTTGNVTGALVTYTTINDGATTLGATLLEVDAQADLSARMVTSSGTETLTVAAHEGRITTLTGSGSAFTRELPAATGSGAIYRFSVGVANTSNHIIDVNATPGTDIMHGVIMSGDTDDNTTDYIWQTLADSDTITLNGTATGGIVGDWIELRDTVSGTWEVFGYTNSSGASEATPFSAAVS